MIRFTSKGLAVAGVAMVLSAGVAVSAEPKQPAVDLAATPLPLSAIRLTDGPLGHAQQVDLQYLLELEPDRMMAYMRERAGLERKAEPYGGWDGEGRQLTGHIAGHYLSAVSLMHAATGNEELKRRADYLVDEMKQVQDGRGSGYLGAILGNDQRRGNAASSEAGAELVDGEELFGRLKDGRIESGGFDLNGMWAPWYVQHKLFAGLRDAYRYAVNKKALEIEIRFAEWVESVIGDLTDEQAQSMLDTEFGGMNEVLVDLYADTDDERWLRLAEKFHHDAIVDPIAAGDNILPGKHGNTQVPKFVGSLDRYLATGDDDSLNEAKHFWNFVVDHHTFATGGHGYDEYFGQPDQLSGQIDGTGQRSRDLRTAESCNVYNMLKLTRGLFALEPDMRYVDYQERALYNHVLASIHPERGELCYMVPVGPGVAHEYNGKFNSFTCCVGTGMESHALHGDGLYYASGDEQVWIPMYVASTATWADASVELKVETDMPLGDKATITLSSDEPRTFTLSLRRPAWAGDEFAVAINGETVGDLGQPDSFINIDREWKSGDTIEVTLPHTLRAEPVENDENRAALMYGPLVLGGDYGPRDRRGERGTVPVFAHAGEPLDSWLKPVDGQPGTFTATTADGRDFTLAPFYTLHDRRYGLYWDLLTPAEWESREATFEAARAEQQRYAESTIAYVQLGEMQPERDYRYEGRGPVTTRVDGQPGRVGGQWLSVKVSDADAPATLIVTTAGDVAVDSITATINGVRLPAPKLAREGDSAFANLTFPIPPETVAGAENLVIRLEASEGVELPAVFGLRLLRAGE